ncbi:GTP cyclohydrolase [Methylomonas koyamae]|uniref:GTP cyclohydrolase n=1 Tax=Methylomonas koyamae TaxID=702114 RepID=A0A177NNQ3_9GAMM|nr:RibD family protein [Methylomonas koyamae]OAI19194.1 GTP cyclohydrolase [Methylomonas koyamae]
MNLNRQIERWLLIQRRAAAVRNRPFVTLSYAQSWDGSITTRAGESLGLSGAESLRLTHQLRSLHDGILVGIGTVLTDDPQLTVREWPGHSPQPIVLDSRLRMPSSARLCRRDDKRCWVLTRTGHNRQLAGHAEVVGLAGDATGRVDLFAALHWLKQQGIRHLMVEGGAEVITAFLKAGLADALVLTIAPTLVGGLKGVGDLQIGAKQPLPRLHAMQSHMLGDDLILWGSLQYHREAAIAC